MRIEKIVKDGQAAAVVISAEKVIWDTQSALDVMMTIQYETGCSRFALAKEQLAEAFFDLRTGLAVEILQKFVNYRMKVAIYGALTADIRRALGDLIEASHQERMVCLADDQESAIAWLLQSSGVPGT